MADNQFGGTRYFAMGAVWWFVVGGALGLLHLIFPGLTETPLVVVLAVLVAVIGSFTIVWLARPK